MMPRYEVLSHTADTGVVVYGATMIELFENAAFAMFDLMFGFAGRNGKGSIDVEVAADTLEELLVDWLSTLLYEAETRDLALCSFEVEAIADGRLQGRASGISSLDLDLAGPLVKAVTYHDLVIARVSTGWSARIVFDV